MVKYVNIYPVHTQILIIHKVVSPQIGKMLCNLHLYAKVIFVISRAGTVYDRFVSSRPTDRDKQPSVPRVNLHKLILHFPGLHKEVSVTEEATQTWGEFVRLWFRCRPSHPGDRAAASGQTSTVMSFHVLILLRPAFSCKSVTTNLSKH